MKTKIATLILLASTLIGAAAQTVPIKFVWNNPLVAEPLTTTNLMYKLYSTTNLVLPTNQWNVTLLGYAFTNTPTTLCATGLFTYDNWFFYMTWTNPLWKKESFFSNQVVPDRLPSQQFNFNLQPTP